MTINVAGSELQVFHNNSTDATKIHNWPFNELAGSTAHDVVSGANLELFGNVTLNSDSFDGNRTLGFDGSDDYGAIQNFFYESGETIDAISVAAWVKTTDVNSSIISFDHNAVWQLDINATGKAEWITTDTSASTNTMASTTSINDGNWHHVVGTFFQGNGVVENKEIYIDGVREDLDTAHGTRELGGRSFDRYGFVGVGSEAAVFNGNNDSDYFAGDIASIYIYSKRLNVTEVATLGGVGFISDIPDFTIPGDKILDATITQRIEADKDSGRFTIENFDDAYSITGDEIRSGDRIRFRTKLEGDTDMESRWVGLVRTVVYEERHFNDKKVIIEADDYVTGKLATTTVEPIGTGKSASEVIKEMLDRHVDGVNSDLVQEDPTQVDDEFGLSNALKSIFTVAKKADGFLSTKEESLEFLLNSNLQPLFTLTDADMGSRIIRYDDSSLANLIRVHGGIGSSPDDAHDSHDSFTTVSSSNSIVQPLTPTKSAISSVRIWTKTISGGDDLVARIHPDDGAGNPQDEDDYKLDIVRGSVKAQDVVNIGYTEVFFPDHKLPTSDVVLIIESDGSTGQDVGYDTVQQKPHFETRFSYPILAEEQDTQSQADHGTRIVEILLDGLKSVRSAVDEAQALLEANAEPDAVIEFDALSARTHKLEAGQVVTVNVTNLSGDCIVEEIQHTYEGDLLRSKIIALDLDTV